MNIYFIRYIYMIAIFGAGIAGLTSALELVNKGFKVTIYEKDVLPGGMAKSKRINGIPTEHSWRGYTKFYNNIFDILERTPIEGKYFTLEEVQKHYKITDAWVTYKNDVYDITNFISQHPGGNIILNALGRDLEEVWKSYSVKWHMKNASIMKTLETYKIGSLKLTSNLTAKNNLYTGLKMIMYNDKITKKNITDMILDIPVLFYHFMIFSTSNKRSDKYYSTRLLDYFENKVSKYTYDSVINLWLGPGLGLDKENCSLGTFFHYINLDWGAEKSGYNSWSVMKKPTSEAFIDPLVTLLISKGVTFNYNCELKQININNNKIISCDILSNDQNKKIAADDFIIAINPNNCYDIFKNSQMVNLAEQHLKLSITNNQISFRLGFKNKINFKNKTSGLVLVDSPYDITFYPQEDFFNVPIDTNNNLKSLWSGTCIQTYNLGILYSKSATQLKKDELIAEIIQQILRCEELQNEIFEVNGYRLEKKDIIYTEIWDDWYWNGSNLESKNKKWVNTFINEIYKPNQKTEYENLYLAGAHTNTSLKIWSMESACESGKLAANLILEKNKMKKCVVYIHDKPSYFKFFEQYDDFLVNNNLPSIIDIFIFIVVIYIIKMIL